MSPPPIPVAFPDDFRPPAAPEPTPTPPDVPGPGLFRSVGLLLLLVLIQGVPAFAITLAARAVPAGGVETLHVALWAATLVTPVFAVVVVRNRYGAAAGRAVALRPVRPTQSVLVLALTLPLGVVCLEVAQVAADVLSRSPGHLHGSLFDRLDRAYEADLRLPLVWALLFGAALPAVGEELLFRGYIGRGLVARHRAAGGVLLTSLLFGLMHADPVRIAATFVLGVVLHAVYLATRSLFAPVLLHLTHNALVVLSYKLTGGQTDLIALTPRGHVPALLLAAAVAAVLVILSALFRLRPDWRTPDGSAWSPAFISAEAPPPEAGAALTTRRLGRARAGAVAVALAAFVAAAWPAVRAAADVRRAYGVFARAAEQYDGQDFAGAAATYAEGIRLTPDDPAGYVGRGLSRLCAGDPAAALADFDRAAELDRTSGDELEGRAVALAALGRHGEADAAFRALPRANLKDADVRTRWGDFFRHRGAERLDAKDHPAARADLDRCVNVNPRDADGLARRGYLHHCEGRPSDAVADYRAALRLQPDDDRTRTNLALCQLDLKEYAVAVRELSTVLRRQPRNADALLARAGGFQALGDRQQALADLTAAVTVAPESAAAWSQRARAYEDAGDVKRAIADWSRAVRLEPTEAEYVSGRGFAYLQDLDVPHALADLAAAVRLDPSDAAVYDALAYLHTSSRNPTPDARKAVEYATRANELSHHRNPMYLENLAAAHWAAGNAPEAVKWQSKAVAVGHADPEADAAAKARLWHYGGK